MVARLPKPSGTATEIRLKRGITVGRMREEQPAMGQPTQKTVPGPNASVQ
jgi:hypothetical protein